MNEPTKNEDYKPTVPETKYYKWEEQEEITIGKLRALLSTRIAAYDGEARETHEKTLTAIENLWAKRGFDKLPTKKLKALLIAAARDTGWYRKATAQPSTKPKQPDDPTLKTCPTCKETKPRTHFVRKVSAARAKQYKWRENSEIRIAHEQCNYCASPKRQSLSPKRTTPSISKLRKQINETAKVTRRMADSAYKERKLELLEECRWKLKDYLTRKVRGPDEWHMMLTKEEREELEALHLRVFWSRRKPSVF